MFDRLRRRMARALAERAGFPPPRVADGAEAATLRAALGEFLERDADGFRRLFLGAEPTPVAPSLLRLLEGAGLAEARGAVAAPRVRLFPFDGRLVATDLLSRALPDQVFSLMFEQVYLGRHLGARPGEAVLELCLGSGVNALAAAARGARVAGVEVSPRAAAFARFNRALNGAALEVLEGDLFGPVAGRRFDLVLVNPPFEPVPPGEEWFLHSHGGEDGLAVVRAILAGLPPRLAAGGRFEIITWSPATADGPILLDLLRAALPGHGLEVHVLGEGPLEGHVEPFASSPGYGAWLASLRGRGIDRVAFLFVRAAPGTPGVAVTRPEEAIAACHAVADAFLAG